MKHVTYRNPLLGASAWRRWMSRLIKISLFHGARMSHVGIFSAGSIDGSGWQIYPQPTPVMRSIRLPQRAYPHQVTLMNSSRALFIHIKDHKPGSLCRLKPNSSHHISLRFTQNR